MSKPTDNSAFQSTKQVLDELDALMERMLSLPVKDGEESPAAKPPLNHPTVAASLTVMEPEPLPTPVQVQPPAPIPIHRPAPPEVRTPLRFTPPAPTLTLTAPAHSSPLLRHPLLWLNDRYDGFMGWLGPLGRWMSDGRGRTLVGLTGLGLIAAGGVWLWIDGVSWP